jgi:hypothetical protein
MQWFLYFGQLSPFAPLYSSYLVVAVVARPSHVKPRREGGNPPR